MNSIQNYITGLGNVVLIAAIFVGSMIMAMLTQTFAENFYPELNEKRDFLFWVWLAIWLAVLTVLGTAAKGFLDI